MKKQIIRYQNLISIIIICCLYMTLNCVFADQSNLPLSSKNNTISTKQIESSSSNNSNLTDTKPLSPMAQKHIFSPEPDGSNNNSGMIGNSDGLPNNAQQNIDMLMQKVKREIELTGIVITPSSKKAMILYKGKAAGAGSVNKQLPELYESGSSIEEYVLKEVFPNYVVIAQNNLEIRLGLFTEKNNRPEELREPSIQNSNMGQTMPINPQDIINSVNPPDGNTQNEDLPINVPMPINPEQMQSNAERPEKAMEQDENKQPPEMPNPFMKAMQERANQPEPTNIQGDTNFHSGTDGNMGANPFLQAIQRARERQKSQQ